MTKAIAYFSPDGAFTGAGALPPGSTDEQFGQAAAQHVQLNPGASAHIVDEAALHAELNSVGWRYQHIKWDAATQTVIADTAGYTAEIRAQEIAEIRRQHDRQIDEHQSRRLLLHVANQLQSLVQALKDHNPDAVPEGVPHSPEDKAEHDELLAHHASVTDAEAAAIAAAKQRHAAEDADAK